MWEVTWARLLVVGPGQEPVFIFTLYIVSCKAFLPSQTLVWKFGIMGEFEGDFVQSLISEDN